METKKIHAMEDVEKVLNDPERQAAIRSYHKKRKAKIRRKMLIDVCVHLAFAIALGAFGIVGWMVERLAYPLCAVCALYSSFQFGRWFENCKFGGSR